MLQQENNSKVPKNINSAYTAVKPGQEMALLMHLSAFNAYKHCSRLGITQQVLTLSHMETLLQKTGENLLQDGGEKQHFTHNFVEWNIS